MESKIRGGECKENGILHTYLHDIRNMKKISKSDLDIICTMSSEDKMSIITTFNDIMEVLKILLE